VRSEFDPMEYEGGDEFEDLEGGDVRKENAEQQQHLEKEEQELNDDEN
ncbi:hypothetical protein K4G61_g4262, partial [Candida parapsilosis]